MNKKIFSVRAGAAGKQILKALKHVFLHNGWVKLVALLISLVLWAGLISQDASVTREKTWQVSVPVTGLDTLRRNGFVVVDDLETLLSNVTVTAAVPQKQFEGAEPSAYNLRADLSKITGTGEQELRISSTSSPTYGKVISTSPSVINVTVEKLSIRHIPVSVGTIGWYGDWYILVTSADPKTIDISGPGSLVQPVAKAGINLDPETLDCSNETLLTTEEIRLLNRSGEEIRSPLIGITTDNISIDSVIVEAAIYPTKTFQMNEMIDLQSKVKKGFRIKSVTFSPETVRVAARKEVLEQLNELAWDFTDSIDELSDSAKFQIKIMKPSDDAIISNETVSVTIEIEAEHD